MTPAGAGDIASAEDRQRTAACIADVLQEPLWMPVSKTWYDDANQDYVLNVTTAESKPSTQIGGVCSS